MTTANDRRGSEALASNLKVMNEQDHAANPKRQSNDFDGMFTALAAKDRANTGKDRANTVF